MAFSKRPKSEAEFIAGADINPPETPTDPIPIAAGLGSTGFDPKAVKGMIERVTNSEQCQPWTEFDPDARAGLIFTLRLNEYEFAMLRHLADQNEDLSMQKIVRRVLVPELRRRAGVDP